MAVNRSNIVHPGSVLTRAVNGKKNLKHPGKQIALSHPVTVPETTPSPPEIGASSERTAAFDPRLFLAKLGVGKSKQEYQDNESVFSQGDAADAVFYLQSGKVKLTAVSTQGKEAVVPSCRKLAFSARAVWRANRFAWPPRAQSNGAPSFGWRSESW